MPTPPQDKEADFSHYFDKHNKELANKPSAEAPVSKFRITKKFYILVGFLVVLAIIQIVIFYSFQAPKPTFKGAPKNAQQR